MTTEKAKPQGVYFNLKELSKTFSEAYWAIDMITRRHRGNLDTCWVTLPYLEKLSSSIFRVVETGERTLKEIRQKSEEFRASLFENFEEKDKIKE